MICADCNKEIVDRDYISISSNLRDDSYMGPPIATTYSVKTVASLEYHTSCFAHIAGKDFIKKLNYLEDMRYDMFDKANERKDYSMPYTMSSHSGNLLPHYDDINIRTYSIVICHKCKSIWCDGNCE